MQEADKSEPKGHFADDDKIEYTHHGPTVAPLYNRGYTITITPDELVIAIKNYSKILLTEKRSFTRDKFDKLLESLKDLKETNALMQDATPIGGSSGGIVFYKDGKEIFKKHSCGSKAKNLVGGEVDLFNLVPDLAALIESTKKE